MCLAVAVTSATLSFFHRIPVVTAWSTPGAALIAATAVAGVPGYSMEVAVGAFMLAALLILFSAALKPLTELIARIPGAIAAAMLAGVLIGFSIAVFDEATADPLLVLPLLAAFLLVRLVSATWAVIAVLVAGVGWAAVLGKNAGSVSITQWEFVPPVFDPAALLGLGMPLFLVSMASQNLPGFAVLRTVGYVPPVRSALAATGLASFVTALFGSHTTTMAAITAALCTGPETHPDPAKRWMAGVLYGGIYLVLAAIGVSVVAGFAALPAGVIITVAGLALIGPLMGALSAALGPEATRFPAVLTITATASGLSLFGVGSAFWGLVLGLLALGGDRVVRHLKKA